MEPEMEPKGSPHGAQKGGQMETDGGKDVENGGQEGDRGDFGGKMGRQSQWEMQGPAEFRMAVGKTN